MKITCPDDQQAQSQQFKVAIDDQLELLNVLYADGKLYGIFKDSKTMCKAVGKLNVLN